MEACILIRAMPGTVIKVLGMIKGMKGVTNAFAVYGRYDIVVFTEALDFKSVSDISGQINAIKGVKSTETAVEG